MTFRVKDATFVMSAERSSQLPPMGLPEIAIVGRSNVGKSSFINRVTGRTKLARTSGTPGQTRYCNLFLLRFVRGSGPDEQLHLVDLPGFGYAKRSHHERDEFGRINLGYLTDRENVAAVCLLNDCRRDPEEEEFVVRSMVIESGAHLLVVLTKIDKLGKNERRKRIQAVASAYGLEPEDLVLSGEKFDVTPFWERVSLLLNVDAAG